MIDGVGGGLGQAYGRPIHGQLEIVGLHRNDHTCKWQTAEGLYIHQSTFNAKLNPRQGLYEHTEL